MRRRCQRGYAYALPRGGNGRGCVCARRDGCCNVCRRCNVCSTRTATTSARGGATSQTLFAICGKGGQGCAVSSIARSSRCASPRRNVNRSDSASWDRATPCRRGDQLKASARAKQVTPNGKRTGRVPVGVAMKQSRRRGCAAHGRDREYQAFDRQLYAQTPHPCSSASRGKVFSERRRTASET